MQLSLFEQSTLEAINETGSTTGSYIMVADKLGLSGADLRQKVQRGAQVLGKWQHKIRLTQQRLIQGCYSKDHDEWAKQAKRSNLSLQGWVNKTLNSVADKDPSK